MQVREHDEVDEDEGLRGTRWHRRAAALLAVVALAGGATACGGDDDDAATGDPSAEDEGTGGEDADADADAGADDDGGLSFTIEPDSGPIGTVITVTGTGCDGVAVGVSLSREEGDVFSFVENGDQTPADASQIAADGSFTDSFTVSAEASAMQDDGTDVTVPVEPGEYETSVGCLFSEEEQDKDLHADGPTFTVTAG
jgi:hypothetical protein